MEEETLQPFSFLTTGRGDRFRMPNDSSPVLLQLAAERRHGGVRELATVRSLRCLSNSLCKE